MNFRSIAQLSDQLLHWSRQIPKDIELVAGVPRSGLLAANILALYLNVPLTDVNGLITGRILDTGRRGRLSSEEANQFLSIPRKVLVLDDSVQSGRSIEAVKERLGEGGQHDVVYGAVYVNPERTANVDVYCEALPAPRMFEWNIMDHYHLRHACLDMEGVLCKDPTREENDDGDRYYKFVCNAAPFLIPTRKVGWIVTSRLEKYRAETEEWLRSHGIQYENLVMLDYPSGEWRRRYGTHAAFKADVYRSSGAMLFIESSMRQSIEIAQLAHREVLCVDTMQLVHPNNNPNRRQNSFEVNGHARNGIVNRLSGAATRHFRSFRQQLAGLRGG